MVKQTWLRSLISDAVVTNLVESWVSTAVTAAALDALESLQAVNIKVAHNAEKSAVLLKGLWLVSILMLRLFDIVLKL